MDPKFFRPEYGFSLYHQSLACFKWIVHGFSLRRDRPLGEPRSLGFNNYQPRDVVEGNRRNFIQSVLGLAPEGSRQDDGDPRVGTRLVTLRQIHSDIIYSSTSFSSADPPLDGDGLMTAQTNVLLSVQTADCMPVLIADTEKRVVAAVHAGWRGTLKRIIEKAMAKLQEQFSANPENCIAVVGPSIRGCCYEVGEEVVEAFQAEFAYAPMLFRNPAESRSGRSRKSSLQSDSPPNVKDSPRAQSGQSGKNYLDLSIACKSQLLCSGLAEANIFADPPCTSCDNDQFFSHRAEFGKTGRMMAVIGIRKS